MKDIVIVPTYDRPEYLWVCLEKLEAAGAAKKEVWVCVDAHAGDADLDAGTAVPWVRELFPWVKWIKVLSPHGYYGNSRNILFAFEEALREPDVRYVFLVEDDSMVMPDFFAWHEAVQEEFQPFVSCAGRVNRSLNFAINGPEAIDETCKDLLACVASPRAYGSWAACFPMHAIRHIVRETNRLSFLARPGWEQDIFIQHLMQTVQMFKYEPTTFRSPPEPCLTVSHTQSGFSVWPYVPRAYHMGLRSYHRNAGMSFNGTLDEKVKGVRQMIVSPDKIRSMALLQNDIDPYPAEPTPMWSGPLYLKADFR